MWLIIVQSRIVPLWVQYCDWTTLYSGSTRVLTPEALCLRQVLSRGTTQRHLLAEPVTPLVSGGVHCHKDNLTWLSPPCYVILLNITSIKEVIFYPLFFSFLYTNIVYYHKLVIIPKSLIFTAFLSGYFLGNTNEIIS